MVLEHSLALPFFGIGMKADLLFSLSVLSPVATAEFSKFAGMLSAAPLSSVVKNLSAIQQTVV